MKRIKQIIKNYLQQKLGINEIKIDLDDQSKSDLKQWKEIKALQKATKFHSSMIITGIDVDHSVRSKEYQSWVVVCIKGKQEVVKLQEMRHEDAYSLIESLKQYELHTETTFDLPREIKMFNPIYKKQ